MDGDNFLDAALNFRVDSDQRAAFKTRCNALRVHQSDLLRLFVEKVLSGELEGFDAFVREARERPFGTNEGEAR